jgi:hypothetical protein
MEIKLLKISNFINEKKYTKAFIDFLCLLLSYNLNEYNINSIKGHRWLKLKSFKLLNVLVNLCEIMNVISSVKIKTTISFHEFVMKYQEFSILNNELEIEEDLSEIASLFELEPEEIKKKIKMTK